MPPGCAAVPCLHVCPSLLHHDGDVGQILNFAHPAALECARARCRLQRVSVWLLGHTPTLCMCPAPRAQVVIADMAAHRPVGSALEGRVVDCSKEASSLLCVATDGARSPSTTTTGSSNSTSGARSSANGAAGAGRSVAWVNLAAVISGMFWAAVMML